MADMCSSLQLSSLSPIHARHKGIAIFQWGRAAGFFNKFVNPTTSVRLVLPLLRLLPQILTHFLV